MLVIKESLYVLIQTSPFIITITILLLQLKIQEDKIKTRVIKDVNKDLKPQFMDAHLKNIYRKKLVELIKKEKNEKHSNK